ncbi:alanine--tRNA ligase-related protein [Streptomyces sp. NPDC052036]|uniref:alanine--tRNA ligase-related protein n=1 Tax=Streptomyces sp. NPDC052036 TaxID=3155171 RepID=UPI0034222C66
MISASGDIHQVSAALGARGYRWQPPPVLAPPGSLPGLFPDHGSPSWIEPLLAPLSHARGGVHTVRWSIRTRHMHAVPVATPASAQRVLSAVWAGPRAFRVPIGDVTEALAGAGVDPGGLAFVVSARPPDPNPLYEALRQLGINARRIGFDGPSPAVPSGAVPLAGPRLSIEFPVGVPCSRTCGPGCRCGRYRALAHLRFSAMGQVRSLLEVAVLENGLLGALDGTRDPFGSPRFATLVKSVHEVLPVHGTTVAQAERVRLLVDRSFTVALLIGSGFAPGPRGRAHVVRRLLRHAGTQLALVGVPLARLDELVEVADRSVRTGLGFAPLTDAQLEVVRRERERFAHVLARAPALLEASVTARHPPADRAETLLRLRSQHGVPLGIAMGWCRENDLAVSLRHIARLERDSAGP